MQPEASGLVPGHAPQENTMAQSHRQVCVVATLFKMLLQNKPTNINSMLHV